MFQVRHTIVFAQMRCAVCQR